jgi:hypothetical protein
VVDIEEVTEELLPEVAAFLVEQKNAQVSAPPAGVNLELNLLRWMLVENPARISGYPLGWIMREDGRRIVGSELCVPFRFQFGGTEHTFFLSGNSYVARTHAPKGWWGFLFGEFLKIGRRHQLFSTSAGAVTAEFFRRSGAKTVLGSDRELVRAVRVGRMAAEVLPSVWGSSRLANYLSVGLDRLTLPPMGARHRCQLDRIPTSGEALKYYAMRQVPMDCAVGRRKVEDIEWRFFRKPGIAPELNRWRCEKCNADGLVAHQVVQRGRRRQIVCAKLLEIIGTDGERHEPSVIDALMRRRDLDCISWRPFEGARVGKRPLTRERVFSAPATWFLDRAKEISTQQLRITGADGDSAL